LQTEDLYVEVLYTLANKVGSHGTHSEDLHEYAMNAFHFTREQHRRMLAVAREEKV
jgi:hypothetical protein